MAVTRVGTTAQGRQEVLLGRATNELGQAKADIVVSRWPVWLPPPPARIMNMVSGDWNQDVFPDLAVLVRGDVDGDGDLDLLSMNLPTDSERPRMGKEGICGPP